MSKVVVTGIGITTPLGTGAAENWKNLKNAHVRDWDQVPISNITNFREQAYFLAQQAVEEALQGASLSELNPDRVGCTFSASKPLFDGDTPNSPGLINEFIARQFGLAGECRNVVAACASGAYSIALAASWVEQGICDVVVAGSVEPSPHPLIEAGFHQMGVLSAEGMMRPFDQQRSGFTFGAGAGAVVLESEDHAAHRGARPLARLSGWGLGADAHSAVAFNSNGAKIAGVIDKALSRAGLLPKDIRHVNAHGTATKLNDRIETQALIKSFGKHAPDLMISATKASTGHLLGAAGSVEFVLTVLALRHQFIPPTVTLENPDPDCMLDYTAGQGHAASFDHALSLSFGFGGPIGVLAVSRC